MAEPTSDRVVFGGVTWVASRLQVLPVLRNIKCFQWGVLLTFRGTENELTAAGVARAEWFAGMGRSSQIWRHDEFGDRWTLRRCAKGIWNLELYPSEDGASDFWRANRQCAVDATADILARLARGG